MLVKPVHQLLVEHGGVGRHGEADLRFQRGETFFTIRHHLTDQWHIGKRLSTEEHHVVLALVRRLFQHHLNRLNCSIKFHLVTRRWGGQVFLIAVGTAEVTTGIGIQHDSGQRELVHWLRLNINLRFLASFSYDPEGLELFKGINHISGTETAIKAVSNLGSTDF